MSMIGMDRDFYLQIKNKILASLCPKINYREGIFQIYSSSMTLIGVPRKFRKH